MIQREQQLLNEVETCCASVIYASDPSQDVQAFIRAVGTRNIKLINSAFADALHKGVTAKEMETTLRIGDVDFWLVGVKKDQSIPPFDWSPEEEPILCIAMNTYETIAGTLFKDTGAYTANFNRLNKGWPLPCDCHPRRPTQSK